MVVAANLGGQLLLEGTGGFSNTDVGFTPAGWTRSGEKLCRFEITLAADGKNEVTFVSATSSEESWTGTWDNGLFDGRHLPELRAHTDLGGEQQKPLIIGPVSLRVETGASLSAALSKRYIIAMSKFIAGSLRLLLEDVLQAFCQSAFLIKTWRKLSWGSRMFTILSISAGISLSIAGPAKELFAARKMKRLMGSSETAAVSLDEPETPADPTVPEKKPLLADSTAAADSQEAGATPATPGTPTTNSDPTNPSRNTVLRNMTVSDFIAQRGRGSKHVNARTAYRALVISCSFFWISRAAMPFVFRQRITCEGDPPAGAVYVFFAVAVVDLLVQVWVAMHSRQGFLIMTLTPAKLLIGSFLSVLGKFDTFSDVISTVQLQRCEELTWVSIEGHYFYMPSIGSFTPSVSQIALATLIVGIFLLQALPGAVLLARKQYLGIAFKLSELNLLLVVAEDEGEEFDNVSFEADVGP